MSQTTYEILLYAGKWSPRVRRSLRHSFMRVVQDAVEVEVIANGESDGPCITATVTYPLSDSEGVRDQICEALLYYLRPQYASQVEVEIIHER